MMSNKRGFSGGHDERSKSILPTSTLSNLLSSQRRSAAQSRRHLVQRVMPFANLHKDGSIGNEAVRAFSRDEVSDTQLLMAADRFKSSSCLYSGTNDALLSSQKSVYKINTSYPNKKRTREESMKINEVPQSKTSNIEAEISSSKEERCQKSVSMLSSENKSASLKVDHSSSLSGIFQDTIQQKSIISPKSWPKVDSFETSQIKLNDDKNMNQTKTTMCTFKDSLSRQQLHIQQPITALKELPSNSFNIQSADTTEQQKEAAITLNQTQQPDATVTTLQKKKNKKISPFRFKVGCVVAIRFRSLAIGGNAGIYQIEKVGDSFNRALEFPQNIMMSNTLKYQSTRTEESAVLEANNGNGTNSTKEVTNPKDTCRIDEVNRFDAKQKQFKPFKHNLVEVWTSPAPGQYGGVSLLGKRIRCTFPKSQIDRWRICNSLASENDLKRILEGNVVSLHHSDYDFLISVSLLVDRSSIKNMPYIKAISDDKDVSRASLTERKRLELEKLIRGENSVVIRIYLKSLYDGEHISKVDNIIFAQWVVANRVLTKPIRHKLTKKLRKEAGYITNSLFLGDEYDTQQNQDLNWRWVARKVTDPEICLHDPFGINLGDITAQLVGEVVRIEPNTDASRKSSTSLARVIIRRLWIPDQVKGGRLPMHGELELFSTVDSNKNDIYFEVPIEQLIVIGRRINRCVNILQQPMVEANPNLDWNYTLTHSYDESNNTYTPLNFSQTKESDLIVNNSKEILKVCHFCRRLSSSSIIRKCQNKSCNTDWCKYCSILLDTCTSSDNDETWIGPCCKGYCDCNICLSSKKECSDAEHCMICRKTCLSETLLNCDTCGDRFHKGCVQRHGIISNDTSNSGLFRCRRCSFEEHHYENFNNLLSANSILNRLTRSIWSSNPMDFMIPDDVGLLSLKPSTSPFSSDCNSKKYKHHRSKLRNREPVQKRLKTSKRVKNAQSDEMNGTAEHKFSSLNCDTVVKSEVFMPTCCRIIPFEELKKSHWYLQRGKTICHDNFEQYSFREKSQARIPTANKIEGKNNPNDRATRANQRRILKSLSSLGSSTAMVDRLAGRDREERLRFGKSLIHGWGVFAEEPINAGDMIIEYRGELIGNAVADKRELQYEKAKIGSDYMFRIDEYTVCDATKLGNVARFINASCNPNCYSQIITANESKRIVIYAKRTIQRGEELCYDYKFPIEYDKDKRISCRCGSSECKGFMNWDKKYL